MSVSGDDRRGAWIASLTSRCPHCEVARSYAGRERLLEGSRARVAFLGDVWGTPIEHPLQGNRTADPPEG